MERDLAAERTWARQWTRAGTALAKIRARDLGSMTTEAALAASEEVLDLALTTPLADWRRDWSGLVEWHRLLHRPRP